MSLRVSFYSSTALPSVLSFNCVRNDLPSVDGSWYPRHHPTSPRADRPRPVKADGMSPLRLRSSCAEPLQETAHQTVQDELPVIVEQYRTSVDVQQRLLETAESIAQLQRGLQDVVSSNPSVRLTITHPDPGITRYTAARPPSDTRKAYNLPTNSYKQARSVTAASFPCYRLATCRRTAIRGKSTSRCCAQTSCCETWCGAED
jgi:hypothetical protein